ncbi:NaeI family type II restriction endonuclease [Arthrobacter koreensis]|uniref:NaeI family type II restriction endonuclease n=1 Tax=Arthrobacter koreensis TaxID=199136 RepID=UPI0036DAE3FC
MPPKKIVDLGVACQPDFRKALASQKHVLVDPARDDKLQRVYAWLTANERDLAKHLVLAADAAIKYVLDGARTRRLDLNDPRVDKDERASVGTKLQYHVLEELKLDKVAPLDTIIENIPVELKSTVRKNWYIPVEGQCQVTMLIQLDLDEWEVSAWLMRTHRVLLNDGANQDKKRTISKANFNKYALQLIPPTPLGPEPLKTLSKLDSQVIFGKKGIKTRIAHLLSVLPNVILPRTSIALVGGTADDVMKRAREAKSSVAEDHGYLTLVGSWLPQQKALRELGFDPIGEPWVSISPEYLRKKTGPPMNLGLAPKKKSDKDFLALVNKLPVDVRNQWIKRFPDLR